MDSQQIKKQSMLLGSFYGDAFALGPHWMYDTGMIKGFFGDIRTLTSPPPNSFHKGKTKGDFTHYGDQTLFLLRLINETGGFDPETASRKWAGYMKSYSGYMDHASKETLANMKSNRSGAAGSGSSDLAGASRIAPFLYFFDDPDELAIKVREQTAMTHNNDAVIEAALFFARTCRRTLMGEGVNESVLAEHEALPPGTVRELAGKGISAKNNDSLDSMEKFGSSCMVSHSLPGTVQIMLKHSNNFIDAMNANVMAGGDSAARGMIIGMILGAALEPDKGFFGEMNKYREIGRLL